MISEGNHVKFARLVLLADLYIFTSKLSSPLFFLFNSVFVIRLGMITHASTLIILDITTASYNDCSLRV